MYLPLQNHSAASDEVIAELDHQQRRAIAFVTNAGSLHGLTNKEAYACHMHQLGVCNIPVMLPSMQAMNVI